MHTQNHQPPWGKLKHQFPRLRRRLRTDIVIVGGGITGVLLAYWLASRGKQVVLVEKNKLFSGASGHTTAFLTSLIDTAYDDLIAIHGKIIARRIWQSHQDAIDFVERVVNTENIDCGFIRCNNYVYANDDLEFQSLKKKAVILKKFGADVRLQKRSDLGFSCTGYMGVNNQAKLDPRLFVNGLIERALERGVQFFEDSEVIEMSSDEKRCIVSLKRASIEASFGVVASYQPFNNPRQVFLKKGMYISYVHECTMPHGIIPEGIYEDQKNPYHYFRLDAGDRVDTILIGGADHRADLPIDREKQFTVVEKYARTLFGDMIAFRRRWSGPILEPSDGLALIGAYQERELIATAFSGNGFTYAAITAELIEAYIEGRRHTLSGIYDPKRVPSLKALAIKGRDYVEELWHGTIKPRI